MTAKSTHFKGVNEITFPRVVPDMLMFVEQLAHPPCLIMPFPELRHHIRTDELAIKAHLRSSDRNLGVCCVALRSCGGAFQVAGICLKYLIS